MSRVTEIDSDDEFEIEKFQHMVLGAYRKDGQREKLVTFLKYLESMQKREIIADRFVRPRDGAMCSIAAFCASQGEVPADLRKVEAESRLQRIMNEGPEENNGWDGPTVGAGMKAGLEEFVAHDLMWMNEMMWDQVDTGDVEVHPTLFTVDKSPVEIAVRVGRSIPYEYTWTEIAGPFRRMISDGSRKRIYREMNEFERWEKLKSYIAGKIAMIDGPEPKPPKRDDDE